MKKLLIMALVCSSLAQASQQNKTSKEVAAKESADYSKEKLLHYDSPKSVLKWVEEKCMVEAVAWSPCSKKIAITTSSNAYGSTESFTHIYDVFTAQKITSKVFAGVGYILWSHNSKKLLLRSAGAHKIYAWEIDTDNVRAYSYPQGSDTLAHYLQWSTKDNAIRMTTPSRYLMWRLYDKNKDDKVEISNNVDAFNYDRMMPHNMTSSIGPQSNIMKVVGTDHCTTMIFKVDKTPTLRRFSSPDKKSIAFVDIMGRECSIFDCDQSHQSCALFAALDSMSPEAIKAAMANINK